MKIQCQIKKKNDIETAKKRQRNKANVKLMIDYLVRATKTIPIGTELKVHYDW